MTREEAILKTGELGCYARAQGWDDDYTQAVNMAIKALEQEPCEDAIRRQDALDCLTATGLKKFDFILDARDKIKNMPSVNPQEPCFNCCNGDQIEKAKLCQKSYLAGMEHKQEPKWIPVSERLPELNKPLLVTAYHRVCYAHMISERGNYGYPVFRLHEIKDSDRGWVQETISHEPYSMGRINAWMYIDIPEPYKASPTGAEGSEE